MTKRSACQLLRAFGEDTTGDREDVINRLRRAAWARTPKGAGLLYVRLEPEHAYIAGGTERISDMQRKCRRELHRDWREHLCYFDDNDNLVDLHLHRARRVGDVYNDMRINHHTLFFRLTDHSELIVNLKSAKNKSKIDEPITMKRGDTLVVLRDVFWQRFDCRDQLVSFFEKNPGQPGNGENLELPLETRLADLTRFDDPHHVVIWVHTPHQAWSADPADSQEEWIFARVGPQWWEYFNQQRYFVIQLVRNLTTFGDVKNSIVQHATNNYLDRNLMRLFSDSGPNNTNGFPDEMLVNQSVVYIHRRAELYLKLLEPAPAPAPAPVPAPAQDDPEEDSDSDREPVYRVMVHFRVNGMYHNMRNNEDFNHTSKIRDVREWFKGGDIPRIYLPTDFPFNTLQVFASNLWEGMDNAIACGMDDLLSDYLPDPSGIHLFFWLHHAGTSLSWTTEHPATVPGAAAPEAAPIFGAAVPPDDSPFASAVGTPQTTQNADAQDRMTETGFLCPASVIDFLHISIR